MRVFLFLLLLCAPVWAAETVVRVRYGDINEVRALLQTLVPDVRYHELQDPPRLRLTGSEEALGQVLELLAEFDRPSERVELDVSIVDTMAMLGEAGRFVTTVLPQVTEMFPTVYRWPTQVDSPGKGVSFHLADGSRGLVLNIKPSVKADGYVVLELRPELTIGRERIINTSMRIRRDDVVLLGGLFSEADAELALREGLPELSRFFAPIGRPGDLAIAIRMRVLPP